MAATAKSARLSNAKGGMADRLGLNRKTSRKNLVFRSYEESHCFDALPSPPSFCKPASPLLLNNDVIFEPVDVPVSPMLEDVEKTNMAFSQRREPVDGSSAALLRSLEIVAVLDSRARSNESHTALLTVKDVRQWRSAVESTWSALHNAHPQGPHPQPSSSSQPPKRERKIKRKAVPKLSDLDLSHLPPPRASHADGEKKVSVPRPEDIHLSPKMRSSVLLAPMRRLDVSTPVSESFTDRKTTTDRRASIANAPTPTTAAHFYDKYDLTPTVESKMSRRPISLAPRARANVEDSDDLEVLSQDDYHSASESIRANALALFDGEEDSASDGSVFDSITPPLGGLSSLESSPQTSISDLPSVSDDHAHVVTLGGSPTQNGRRNLAGVSSLFKQFGKRQPTTAKVDGEAWEHKGR